MLFEPEEKIRHRLFTERIVLDFFGATVKLYKKATKTSK
jgi:hypothetical protein